MGRMHEIYGPPSSGKSTVALMSTANAQKQGYLPAYIDMEHSVDIDYAKSLGVDFGSLLFSQPNHGEEAMDIVDALITTDKVKFIAVDSIDSLVPLEVIENGMTKDSWAKQARLMSQLCRKINVALEKKGVCVLFVNQTRTDTNVTYGSNESTPGGSAMKFYGSSRVRVGAKGRQGDFQGMSIRVVKNKVYKPYLKGETKIIYGKGIDLVGEVIDLAVAQKLIDRRGAWYYHNDLQIGQGEAAVRQFFSDNPEFLEQIKGELQ